MIRLQQVTVVLDEQTVLRSVDFTWRGGESVALVGANGAGKSTLLKVLATLVKPSSGRIVLPAGYDLQAWRRSIGTMFPETFLYDSLTASENLDFYRQVYGVRDKGSVEQALDQVGLFEVRNERVSTFSKGMRQRLSIARALLHKPAFLLLDEPFDGLDFHSKGILEKMLMELKQNGVGWILVSHDIQQAWASCDRIVLLHQGRIVLEDRCVKDNYPSFVSSYESLLKETSYALS